MGHLEVFIVIKRIPKSDYNYCNQNKNKKNPAKMHLINFSKEVKSKMAKCKFQPLIHRLLSALTDLSTGMQMVINICILEVYMYR